MSGRGNKRTGATIIPIVGASCALRGAIFRCELGPARDGFAPCSILRTCFRSATLIPVFGASLALRVTSFRYERRPARGTFLRTC